MLGKRSLSARSAQDQDNIQRSKWSPYVIKRFREGDVAEKSNTAIGLPERKSSTAGTGNDNRREIPMSVTPVSKRRKLVLDPEDTPQEAAGTENSRYGVRLEELRSSLTASVEYLVSEQKKVFEENENLENERNEARAEAEVAKDTLKECHIEVEALRDNERTQKQLVAELRRQQDSNVEMRHAAKAVAEELRTMTGQNCGKVGQLLDRLRDAVG